MLISVVVPIYNKEKYIAKCIESLINQDIDDYEIILVNDGSTDNSLGVCEKFAKSNLNIRIVNKENGGVTSARRTGAEVTVGDYILAVDPDDYIQENIFSKFKEIIEQYSPDVIQYNMLGVYADRVVEMPKELIDCTTKQEVVDNYANNYIQGDLNISKTIWAKLIKRELYLHCQKQVPDYISMGDDRLFCLHLYNNAESVRCVRNVHYYYVQNEDSMCHEFSMRKIESKIVFSNEVEKTKYVNDENRIYIDKYRLETYIEGIKELIYVKWNIENLKLLRRKILTINKNAHKLLSLKNKISYLLIRNKMFWLLKLLLKERSV